MDVQMGDAPPAFFGNNLVSINLAISEIDVVDSSGSDVVVAQYNSPMIVNLLNYQNGAGESIGQASVNTQTYQTIRFVVDIADSGVLFNGGILAPLNFVTDSDSSSSHAGKATSITPAGPGRLAIIVREPFSIGTSADELVNVDFNLLESLAPPSMNADRGNGNHNGFNPNLGLRVRPALFVAGNANGGEISGSIVNQKGRGVFGAVVVAVDQNGKVGNTVGTDSNGNFLLHTLQAGRYQLVVYNNYTNSAGATLEAKFESSDQDSMTGPTVVVTPGQNTTVGAIAD